LGVTAAPFTVQGPGVNPADFRVTTFATGLNYPHGMQTLPDGSFLVAVSNPVSPSAGFFNSTGALIRLVDRATYRGEPAYVIASSTRAWVVGLGCTAAKTELVVSVALAGLPGNLRALVSVHWYASQMRGG